MARALGGGRSRSASGKEDREDAGGGWGVKRSAAVSVCLREITDGSEGRRRGKRGCNLYGESKEAVLILMERGKARSPKRGLELGNTSNAVQQLLMFWGEGRCGRSLGFG